MGDTASDRRISTSREPWFTQHPGWALAVAASTFVGVFALRLSVGGSQDSISVLYVLPVALIAFAFGLRAGMAAGVVAVVLLVVWVIVARAAMTPLSWFSCVTPVVLLGALVGASSDRISAARQAERYATAMAMLQRDAAEVNDSVVQGLSATKWLLESGNVDRALAVLEETTRTAQDHVSRVLGAGSLLSDEVRQPQLVIRRSTPPLDP